MGEYSGRVSKYFEYIEKEVDKAYAACNSAKVCGVDPSENVEIPLAKNMAERVEGLISVVDPNVRGSGIPERIQELEKEHGKLSWKVAMVISLETAQEKFCKFENKHKAMEIGIRVGLAYLTLGVVASPLEGFVELKLKKRRDDGKEYFCLMFSGPIRSAGGTAAAVSVIVADYVRKNMGYAEYDASDKEVKRASTELYDYHDRITNLQYLPSVEEIELMAKRLPIQVDGDASEKIEVSNYKDLSRIETNIIRNGFCLVMGEALCQKATKIWKQISEWGHDFGLEQWDFLGDFVKLQKEKKAKGVVKKEGSKITPDYTFIKDLVAGRPILGFPLRNGAFRLRYGRCRNTGYSSAGMNPALTYILDKFIAIGTQLKLERPGKAASMSTCDTIDGPVVKLKDGSVLQVNDVATAKKVSRDVEEVIYLGDILINYGDFFNRAHSLVPAGYNEEWWNFEVEKGLKEKDIKAGERLSELLKNSASIKAREAIEIAKQLDIGLHPKYTYFWNTLSNSEISELMKNIQKSKVVREEEKVKKLVIDFDEGLKRKLELIGVPHKLVNKEYVVFDEDHALIMSMLLGKQLGIAEGANNDIISSLLGLKVRDKCGTFIGARMGRPEKAKVRKLDGQPHCLFPIGEEGGRMRSFGSAVEAGQITSDFPLYRCSCGNDTVLSMCEKCGKKTEKRYTCKICGDVEGEKCLRHGKAVSYRNQSIKIKPIISDVLKQIGMHVMPDLVKGVRGTSNKGHVAEHLAKGLLRAEHKVPVNKDGTTRYDMTQLALTHFKPKEIGASIERLRELGYERDVYGKELRDEEQILELLPQDLVLPRGIESPEEGADEVLFRVAKFIDDSLTRLYKTERYYGIKEKEDLIGQLVVALAPHTSAGIVGRIIGFSNTQGFYAHPLFHAATRRDCDGDEACVTLLVDALLNFSRQYLSSTRGATQDAPLVLTSLLIPSEVDDMAFDLDVVDKYSLELYESALEYKMPWDIKFDQIGNRLDTPGQYEGMMFTHDTTDINLGVKCSAYKLIPSMQDKLHGQMDIAFKIRAVDESEVAKIVIEKHFIKDIKGNLRKFSQQQFRCVGCNEKYRRPPLMGKCLKCGGKIIFTISEGSIVKYLEPALSLANHYNLPNYIKQTLELTKRRVEGLFGKDKEKQIGLGQWFG